jgi:hypothetical protein
LLLHDGLASAAALATSCALIAITLALEESGKEKGRTGCLVVSAVFVLFVFVALYEKVGDPAVSLHAASLGCLPEGGG